MSYEKFPLNLTSEQKQKIASHAKHKKAVSIHLTPKHYSGKDVMLLTKTQISKINNNKKQNKGMILKLSEAQIKKQSQNGGWLSTLLNIGKNVLLPLGLSAVTGAIQGATSSAAAKAVTGSGLKHHTIQLTDTELKLLLKVIKRLESEKYVTQGTQEMVKHHISKQSGGFLPLLMGVIGSLLPSLLTGGKGLRRAGTGLYRSGGKGLSKKKV